MITREEAMPEERIRDLEKMATKLDSNQESISKAIDKIEASITKLTEVSANLAQLIAVQENRLETHQRDLENVECDVKSLNIRITDIKTELHDEINRNFLALSEELEDTFNVENSDIKSINSKVSRIEKFMWLLMGGGVVIGILVSRIVPWMLDYFLK